MLTRDLLVYVFCVLVTFSAGCGSDGSGRDEACDGGAGACDAATADDADASADAGPDAGETDAGADTHTADLEEDLDESELDAPDDVGMDVSDGSLEDTALDQSEDVAVEDVAVEDTADGAVEDAVVEPPPPEDPQPFTIRFATYNVRTSNLNNSAWGDTHVGWDSNDAARMRLIADTIADQNLTVVATQEMRTAELDAVLGRLANAHGENWGHSTRKQGADDTYVIFDKSVWEFVRETHFLIPMQAGLDDRYQVGALLRHKQTDRRVWFYSVHYAAGGSAGASARKVGAERTLASIQSRALTHDPLFVIGGDFNSVASDPPAGVFRNSGILKYTRTVADKLVGNGCKTFNGNAGSAGNQACPGGAASHIDQVWVSKGGVKVVKYQVTATAHTSRSSDHNPLTTILDRL